MRLYAWYSPEIDVIVLQSIMEDCYISFEWGQDDLYQAFIKHGSLIKITHKYLWFPLGEL